MGFIRQQPGVIRELTIGSIKPLKQGKVPRENPLSSALMPKNFWDEGDSVIAKMFSKP
jgi:hypothetical protein